MEGVFPLFSRVASDTIEPHDDNPQILTAAESPREPQRSKNPYSILRSTGRFKIVVSGDLDCATSIARRLANDLFTYLKLDADIVHETEIIVGPQSNTNALGTGNIVVIGSPSGQYIRQCLAKGMTTFTIAEKESGSPVLQLNGETLSGLSQGNLFAKQSTNGLVHHLSNYRYHVHTSTRIFSLLHDAIHDCA
jgi:hypothetical protein